MIETHQKNGVLLTIFNLNKAFPNQAMLCSLHRPNRPTIIKGCFIQRPSACRKTSIAVYNTEQMEENAVDIFEKITAGV